MNQYTLTTRNGQFYDPNGNLVRLQPLCDAALNLDGSVDVFDFGTFSSNFGQCDPSFTWQDGDLDGNGCVDVFDFSTLSSAFGQVCYPDEIAYDFRNQMVRYVDNVGGPDELTHEYRYDCFGRRLGKKLDTANSTAEQRFYYGGESFWQLCEVRTYPDAATDPEDFTLEGTFVHGPQYIDEVVQYVPGSSGIEDPTEAFYHEDDLFDVMALTDEGGTVIERFEYADYGAPLNQDLSQLASTYPVAPFLFNGRFYDFEVHGNEGEDEYGWYQYRTRSMNPGVGEFTAKDSIGTWGDERNLGNGIAYTMSNPGRFADPFGQIIQDWWHEPAPSVPGGPFPTIVHPPFYRTPDDVPLSRLWDSTVPSWTDLFFTELPASSGGFGMCVISCHGDDIVGPKYTDSNGNTIPLLDWLKHLTPGQLECLHATLKEKCPNGITIYACNSDLGRSTRIWDEIGEYLDIPLRQPTDRIRHLIKDPGDLPTARDHPSEIWLPPFHDRYRTFYPGVRDFR